MLAELGALEKRLRRILVARAAALIPCLGLQRVDHILAAHEIDEAPIEVFREIHVLMLRVEANHALSGFQNVAEDELEKIAFALSAVSEDQDVGIGFVIVTLIEIHDDVGAKLVPSKIKAVGIGFTAVVKGIEICHRAGRQDSFKLRSKHIPAAGPHSLKALLLAKHQPIHIEL
ncbi:hypothetical protein SDC9_161976 [bioreactor metagenome]|uniref:Uncharacterized protein n=1 Tax=bioreactor metagenome TaxID=1076179 RepID=A0A645FMT0_9ZZZZ